MTHLPSKSARCVPLTKCSWMPGTALCSTNAPCRNAVYTPCPQNPGEGHGCGVCAERSRQSPMTTVTCHSAQHIFHISITRCASSASLVVSLLQRHACVAVCCGVLQCVAVCCSVHESPVACHSARHICQILMNCHTCCSVLQCVAAYCSALQCQ